MADSAADKKVINRNAAFAKFMASEEGKKLRADPKAAEGKTALDEFTKWAAIEANAKLPEVAAMKKDGMPTEAEVSGLITGAKRAETVGKAYDLYLKSPEGQALLKNPGAISKKELLEKFKTWVDANKAGTAAVPGKPPAADIPAKPAAPEVVEAAKIFDEIKDNAAKGDVNAAAQTAALELSVGSTFAAAKKAALGTPEEEPGFFGKNKFGMIGGIIAAILGFMLGGPIGGIAGFFLGGGLASKFGDNQGVVNNNLFPEQGSETIALIKKRKGPAGDMQYAILVDGEGKAGQEPAKGQDPKLGSVVVVGHMVGTGDERKFEIIGTAVMDESNLALYKAKKDMVYETASGTLTLTKAGNVDVSNEENKTAIAAASAPAKAAADARKTAAAERKAAEEKAKAEELAAAAGGFGALKKPAASAMADQDLPIGNAATIATQFKPLTIPGIFSDTKDAPNPTAALLAKEVTAENKKSYITINTGDKKVILIGTIGPGGFVAEKAIQLTNGSEQMPGTPIDLSAIEAAKRTFKVDGDKVSIKAGADENRTKVEALLKTDQMNPKGPDLPKDGKGPGKS